MDDDICEQNVGHKCSESDKCPNKPYCLSTCKNDNNCSY